MTHPPLARSRFADWRLAAKSILGFWLFYALTVVARAFLGSDPYATLENKLAVIGVGVILTGAIYLRYCGRRGRVQHPPQGDGRRPDVDRRLDRHGRDR